MPLPKMPYDLVEILRMYKTKSGLNNAQIAVALAGLDEGIIDPQEEIICT